LWFLLLLLLLLLLIALPLPAEPTAASKPIRSCCCC
jgi:hypothetical protein